MHSTLAPPANRRHLSAWKGTRKQVLSATAERKSYSCKEYKEADCCIASSCCGLVIKKAGHYSLCENTVIQSKQAAILILASNVAINLCGFKLSSTTALIGVMIADGARDVTIMNGTLDGFLSNGIFLDGVYKNITLKGLVFQNIRLDSLIAVITDVSETSTILKGKRDLLIEDCVVRNCGNTTATGASTGAFLLQDVEGLVIRDLQVHDCDFAVVMEIRRSLFEIKTANVYANNIMYNVLNGFGSLGNCDNISVAGNTFIALGYPGFDSEISCLLLNEGSFTNCTVTDNTIEKDIFWSAIISVFDTSVRVENFLCQRNKSKGTLNGFYLICADASVEINNSQFLNNKAKEINCLVRTTFINIGGLPPSASSVIVANLKSMQNKATDKYSFVSAYFIPDYEPANEELSMQLEGCRSSNNKGVGISFDLKNTVNTVVRDCVCQNEDTAFFNKSDGNFLERNLANSCNVGFSSNKSGTFIANQALSCGTQYIDVFNILIYLNSDVTVTTNLLN